MPLQTAQKKYDELKARFDKAKLAYDAEHESYCHYSGGSDRQERLRDQFLEDAKRAMQDAERDLEAQEAVLNELNAKK